MSHSNGFTLLEVLLSLLLLALLSTVVALSVRGGTGTLADARSRIARFDSECRLESRRAPQELRFDLDDARLARASRGGKEPVETLRLPRGVRIDSISLVGSGGEAKTTHGEVVIPYSRDGLCATYGLILSSAEGNASLVFTGLSGECLDAEFKDIATILRGDDPR